jgi:LemA protein
MPLPVAIPLAVTIAVLVFIVVAYNRFIRVRIHLRESWSGIDVELHRRYDLIPNLVETVKAHAAHERGVLEAVTEARARAAANLGDHDGQIRDEQVLVGRLRELLAVAEAYPRLQADGSFRALQGQLVETEDRLAAVRRLHNANVREWNTLGELVPWSLLRGTVGWRREPFFEVDQVVRTSVPGPARADGGFFAT